MQKPLTLISLILFTFTSLSSLANEDHEEVTTAQFNQLDADGNGSFSKYEVETKTEVTRWMSISEHGGFELADVNGDGKLEKAEFAAFEEDLPVE